MLGPTKEQYEEAKIIVGPHKRKFVDIVLGRSPYGFEDIKKALMIVSLYEGYHIRAKSERKAEQAAEFGGEWKLFWYQSFVTIVAFIRTIVVAIFTIVALIFFPIIYMVNRLTRPKTQS